MTHVRNLAVSRGLSQRFEDKHGTGDITVKWQETTWYIIPLYWGTKYLLVKQTGSMKVIVGRIHNGIKIIGSKMK
jgi:hypothetical protein